MVQPPPSNSGVSGGYTGSSMTLRIVIGALTAVAWYNALELTVLIFMTFKVFRGLYFWSLLVASWGVIFYATGFLLKFFQIIHNDYVNVALLTVGWWSMITGQSVVLWSRLHLVVHNRRLLKGLLCMIMVDAVVLHLPTTVLTFGSNSHGASLESFVRGYNVMEKIQMTGFCIQEFILSGIYLLESVKFLKSDNMGFEDSSSSTTTTEAHNSKSRRTLHLLFCINILIILMDLVLLSLEYANLYILEICLKGVVYSIKLKLEFAILGQLVQYATPSTVSHSEMALSAIDMGNTMLHKPSQGGGGGGNAIRKRPSAGPAPDSFEHVERLRHGSVCLGPSDTDRSVPGASQEDDLEEMMRKYSVREGQG